MNVLGGILILIGMVFVLAWRIKSRDFLLFKRPTQKNILTTTLLLILGVVYIFFWSQITLMYAIVHSQEKVGVIDSFKQSHQYIFRSRP